ncbi:hypothetical protein [Aequorivita marina]|uniref:hypothetical protein n=1 Tax=Aequorivita marina TaxID=3073654 RepID=UPI002875B1B3|nr:hypothetical protein [Aequorivita sp. S2608]MDS1297948.1 hypothetical protein [Aequorivita sp. S2608]
MKINPLAYLAISTLILVTVAIFAAMDLPFNWVFYLSILGEVFLVISVYKILHDKYATDKTFKDFYEDHPIEQEE